MNNNAGKKCYKVVSVNRRLNYSCSELDDKYRVYYEFNKIIKPKVPSHKLFVFEDLGLAMKYAQSLSAFTSIRLYECQAFEAFQPHGAYMPYVLGESRQRKIIYGHFWYCQRLGNSWTPDTSLYPRDTGYVLANIPTSTIFCDSLKLVQAITDYR